MCCGVGSKGPTEATTCGFESRRWVMQISVAAASYSNFVADASKWPNASLMSF